MSHQSWLKPLALSLVFAGVAVAALAQEETSTPEGLRRAIASFERAAAGGNTEAFVRLGELYLGGEEPDPVRALAYFETAAGKGSLAGQFRLAEIYLDGTGVAADADRGLDLLRSAADAGELRAIVRLAEEYASGANVAADPAQAIARYQEAADRGSTRAMLALANAYRDGTLGTRDEARAVDYYRRAAEGGSAIARARLAETMLSGAGGVPRDVPGAIALLEDAEGDPTASYRLAELLSRGEFVEPEPERAVALYEAAAEGGNLQAYSRLGALYRDGVLVPRSPRRAIEAYETAIAAGFGPAKVEHGLNHANRLYGSASSPAAGVEMIREALEAGEESAAPAFANLHLWGSGVRQSVREARAILAEAAEAGNVSAARLLVAYDRDGRQSLIGRDIGGARQTLERYADVFDPDDLQAEELLIDAAAADGTASFSALRERVQALDVGRRTGVVSALRTANPNLFVYVLQARLTDLGYYGGSLNGRLTPRTIEAINRRCGEAFVDQICRKGPLAPDTGALIANLVG